MTQKTWFGHPVGLFVLFFTEMWERFSYYGMRSLLVLYMTQHLIHSAQNGDTVFGFKALQAGLESLYGPLAIQPLASQIYGLYTGLVYFTPLFGGILADRYFGQRRTVVLGGLLMAAGHFLMALQSCFLLALLLLIFGSGCFKPNVSTQVGNLYPLNDPRRDGAFTIFYMGINLGALFSPLVCGTLGQVYGWHYGFAAAGVGMLIGLLVYLLGQQYLAKDSFAQTAKHTANTLVLTAREWQAIGGLMALATINILFWAVYEQQGNTLQLFADQNTDWHLFGWDMPSTWFQALNPAFIILLTPLLARLTLRNAGKGRQYSSIGKMAFGASLLALAFLVLILAIAGIQPTEKISFLWLLLCTLIYTLGELYFSPVGLALVTKISPPRLVSMLMGMWFLSSFFGNYLSGYIGSYYEKISHDSFFLLLAVMAGITALAIFAFKSMLKRVLGSI
jgi:POT family proton-dependent oligopeptide transporter